MNIQLEGIIERFINTLIYLVAAVLLTKNHISVGEIVAFESYIIMIYLNYFRGFNPLFLILYMDLMLYNHQLKDIKNL